jgi:hypothetical protein
MFYAKCWVLVLFRYNSFVECGGSYDTNHLAWFTLGFLALGFSTEETQ